MIQNLVFNQVIEKNFIPVMWYNIYCYFDKRQEVILCNLYK